LLPFLRIQVAQLICYVGAVWGGLTYGVEFALALGLVANVGGCLMQLLLAIRILDFPARRLRGGALKVGAAAITATLILSLLTMTSLTPALRNCLAAIAFMCTYAALILMGFPDLRAELPLGRKKAHAE
jgi:hypothetical protein